MAGTFKTPRKSKQKRSTKYQLDQALPKDQYQLNAGNRQHMSGFPVKIY